VTLSGDYLEAVNDGAVLARLNYREISVSLTGMDDRYLCFEGPHQGAAVRLLVPDKTITQAIEAIGAPGQFVEALRATERSQARRSYGRTGVLLTLAALLVLGGLLLFFGLGWATGKAAALVPVEWEVALGRHAAEGILQGTQVCSDPELKNALNEIGTRLVGGLGESAYQFKVRVLDDDEVNAFALPGGYVFVNRGLIEQADDGFEVAGVLAHEIEHVVLRHGVNNMVRQAGLILILQAVTGDVGAVEQFLMVNAAELASMSFSRDQERDADMGGLRLMTKAAMDPTGLSRFLKKLAAKEGAAREALSILTTHPASVERTQTLETTLASWPEYPVTPLRFDLSTLKGRCAPISVTDPDAI
jgi:Zn-dependent protease with chaperone function